MPFQTPQGFQQLLQLLRMLGQPQGGTQQIQGMMGLQNPFGSGPGQTAMPNINAAQPPAFTGQPGGLPITQYGYGPEMRFHDPMKFAFTKPKPKPKLQQIIQRDYSSEGD